MLICKVKKFIILNLLTVHSIIFSYTQSESALTQRPGKLLQQFVLLNSNAALC